LPDTVIEPLVEFVATTTTVNVFPSWSALLVHVPEGSLAVPALERVHVIPSPSFEFGHVIVVVVIVTPVSVSEPELGGPLQIKFEPVQIMTRVVVPEFQVYVAVAVYDPVTAVHFAYTVILAVTVVLAVNAVV
jgi:hypothetical protein